MLPKIETKSLAEINKFQERKLRKSIDYISKKSPFYKKLFNEHNIDPVRIKTLEDLQNIPFTTKSDLQTYNDDFICTEKNKIIDYITTSGTLGDPVTFAMTDKDLNRLAYNEAISFYCSGITSKDILLLTTTLDKRFMAGLAYFMGARLLGAGVVRVGAGIPELQWDTIARVSPTAIVAVPSFILKLIEYAEKHNIDYQASPIKKAVCIGESIRNSDFSPSPLTQKINEKWDIQLYSTYASTEMGTAFNECQYQIGGHHHPELIITEFLDENDQPVKEGEAGEVTVTTLGVEGMPLLRFKTGDICHHYTESCKCGRNTIRLGPVIGRKKQMIKYKGTTLYPPAIYDVLNNIESVEEYVVEASTNEIGTDDLLIYLSYKSGAKQFDEKDIKDHFRAKLRVTPKISFLSKEEIMKIKFPATSRKPINFIDKREKYQ